MITKLDDLLELVKTKGKKRLVAAYANDDHTVCHTVCAVSAAVDKGIVDATLVGDIETIKKICAAEGINPDKFELVQEADENKAGVKAVSLIREGKGDILMKGLLSTDKYMRAILNKETGLMPGKKNDMLTHMAVFEIPRYHKLLVCSDVAIVPAPDMKQKQQILSYLISSTSLAVKNYLLDTIDSHIHDETASLCDVAHQSTCVFFRSDDPDKRCRA